MLPEKKPFRFRDLLDILNVNAKVILAIILFLSVFLSIVFGYYSFLLLAFTVIFIIYSFIDAIMTHDENQNNGDYK